MIFLEIFCSNFAPMLIELVRNCSEEFRFVFSDVVVRFQTSLRLVECDFALGFPAPHASHSASLNKRTKSRTESGVAQQHELIASA